MGLFSTISRAFEGGRKFNEMAKAMGKVIELIDEYERHHDVDALYAAAWLCKVGILDIAEQYSFSPMANIRVYVYGRTETMPVHAALLRSYSRLLMKKNDLLADEAKIVDEILEGGPAFYEIDKTIPYEEKKKYY